MSGTDSYEHLLRYAIEGDPLPDDAVEWVTDLIAVHAGGGDIASRLNQARKGMRQRARKEALTACYAIDRSYITLAAHLRRFVTSQAPEWLKDGPPDDLDEWHRNAFRAYCTNINIVLSPKWLRAVIEGE